MKADIRSRMVQFLLRPAPNIDVQPEDIDAFQDHQTSQISRAYSYAERLSPLMGVFALVMLAAFRSGAVKIPGTQVVCTLLVACLPFQLQHARVLSRPSPLLMSLIQMSLFILFFVVLVRSSLATDVDIVRKHRTFLLTFNNVVSFFTFLGHVPFAFHVLALLLAGVAWIAFHAYSGFLSTVSVVYGIFICVAGCAISSVQRASAWKEFKASRDLEEERKFLDSVLSTLNNLLSTLFDASCTCDAGGAGTILTSTPQFQQLVRDDSTGLPLVEALSCSLEERARLHAFLSNVASNGKVAHILETSFRDVEAKLVGIKLPDRDGKNIAFIGLQACAEAFEPQPQEENEAHDVVPDLVVARRAETGDGDESLFSLSLTEVSSVRDVPTGNNAEVKLGMDAMDSPAAEATGSAAAAASAYGAAAEAGAAEPVKGTDMSDHAMRDTGSDASFVSPPCSMALKHAARRVCNDRPPRTPGSLPSSQHRKKKDRHHIVWKTSRKVLPGFKETVEDGVRILIMHAMCQFNSRGAGCCHWHIQLARVSKVLARMAEDACQKKFAVHSGWQCSRCLCMNTDPEEAGEDEEDFFECEVCGHDEPLKGHLSESSCGSNTCQG